MQRIQKVLSQLGAEDGIEDKLVEYKRLEKLGSGSYGVVSKYQHIKTGKFYAIKKILLRSNIVGMDSTTLRELMLLKELKHPNIVLLVDVTSQNSNLYMIFEYLPSDLRKYIESLDKPLCERMQKFYQYQMIQGTLFCHERGIMHRDIKPQNLLIDQKGTIKIADFGLARVISIPLKCYTLEVITQWYRAPELLLGASFYTFGVDIWSLGCVFAELATTRALFVGDCEIDQIFKIFRILGTPTPDVWNSINTLPNYQGTFPMWKERLSDKLARFMSKDGIDIVKATLAYDPVNRITAKELLAHPYYNEVDRSTLPYQEL